MATTLLWALPLHVLIALLADVVNGFLPAPLIRRHQVVFRSRPVLSSIATDKTAPVAVSSGQQSVDVHSEVDKSRIDESKALRSIVGGSTQEFFEQIWQKSSRVYRSQLPDASNDQDLRGWDDERVDKDPFLELVQMGLNGLVSLLTEARGCFDNPDADWRMLLPIVYRQRQMLPLPELRADYGNNLFAAYMDGCSIVLNHADELCPYIASVCLDLQRSFPHAYANAYLTPPASRAVPAHADDRDVLVIQLFGQKHWKVYENVPIPYPYPGEQVGKELPVPPSVLDGPCVVDTALKPGDVLYIPRGLVHEARTDASQPSFHVTIALATFDWALTGILTSAVRHTLDRVNEYRMAIPPSFGMRDLDSIPADQVHALEEQVENALDLVKKEITVGAICHNLRHKHEQHNQRAFPKRMARINEARTMPKGCSDSTNIVVGQDAASAVTLSTCVRGCTPEETDLDSSSSPPDLRIREETEDAMLEMLEKLRTYPSHESCRVSQLPSLLAKPCDLICDLTLLSFVKTNVELGNMAIVR